LKEANKDGYVDVFQGEYNLLSRGAEKELFPYVSEHTISFIPYFPLASGLLTGKYNKNTYLSEKMRKRPQFREGVYEENLEKIEKVRKISG
jgi:myo-inositol catabolism protein IolS